MDPDQEAQQNAPHRDYANKSIQMAQNARKAKNAISTVKNVKKVADTARKVQAVGSFIAATWEIWVIVLVIIVIVVLFLVIITAIMGQNNNNQQPTTTTTSVDTFVALGDSLTAWPNQPTKPYTTAGGSIDGVGTPWPSHLAAEEPALKLVNNAGVPAETTTQILSRFNSSVAAYHPDVLFVLGGTNDYGKPINTIANLKQIIADAQNANIKKVVLLTVPHQCPGSYALLNREIIGLKSDYVSVIDVNQPTLSCTGGDYQSDHLHFTDAGAQVIANIIDGQIKAQNILPLPPATAGPAPVQSPNEVVYCQGRESWSSQAYDDGNIGTTGCVPTSTAMVLSSYGGTTYTPGQIATMFHNNHWDYLAGSGQRGTNPWDISSTWLNSLGFKRAQADVANNYKTGVILNANQLQLIKNYTDAGWLLLAAVDGHNLPTRVNGLHEIVIEGINLQTDVVTVRDPNSPNCRVGKPVSFNALNIRWYLIMPVKIK